MNCGIILTVVSRAAKIDSVAIHWEVLTRGAGVKFVFLSHVTNVLITPHRFVNLTGIWSSNKECV
jgi:hypothetical protein